MKHHSDRGSDSEFYDPSGWARASFNHHPCDDFEPIELAPNGYRAIFLDFLKLMLAVDEYVTGAEDARLAVIAVSLVLQWPSTRGLSVGNIANQVGCSPATVSRACARFREISGLGPGAGGVRFIRPGAGSNGDKPAAVRA